jgi:hypothetical protein
MNTKNPRINVTFDKEDLELIQILSEKKELSLSGLVQHIVHEWLEEYEDVLLLKRIEEIENDTVKYVSHDEFWEKALGEKSCIKSSTPSPKVKKTSKRSRKA